MPSNSSSTAGMTLSSTAQKNAPKGLWLALTQLLNGVENEIPSTSKVMIAGQTVTQAALSSELESDIALFQAVINARTQYEAALAARIAAASTMKQRYALIVKAIQGLFAPGDPQLAQFGIHPQKARTPLTTTKKAVAAAKGKLTRAARHTMGSQEKLKIQTVGTPTLTITPTGTQVVPQVLVSAATTAGSSTPQPAAPVSGSTPSGS